MVVVVDSGSETNIYNEICSFLKVDSVRSI